MENINKGSKGIPMKTLAEKAHDSLPNYEEYSDLFEEWNHEDLKRAYDALHSCEASDELYEMESPLLAFMIDTTLQEKLHLYFEDLRNDEEWGTLWE